MSWDDEDFDVPAHNSAAAASWEDGVEDDDPVLESWDVDEEEEERKKKEAEAKKKAEKEALHKRQAEAKAKKLAAKNGGEKVLLEIDKVDPKTRAEMLRQAELKADLNNAADLFGGLEVADDVNEHPKERAARLAASKQQAESSKADNLTKETPLDVHPLFKPESKQDFEKLRKGLSTTLTKLADDSLLNYSSVLAVDLVRDLCKPLSTETMRKLQSTLNVIMKEKERAERQARLQKAGGTSTGGAGKKKAKPAANPNVNQNFKKDVFDDMKDNYDDFGDDDFM